MNPFGGIELTVTNAGSDDDSHPYAEVELVINGAVTTFSGRVTMLEGGGEFKLIGNVQSIKHGKRDTIDDMSRLRRFDRF